jgi:hypothetical protein
MTVLSAAEAAAYRRRNNQAVMDVIALQVVTAHADGGWCGECRSGLRCPRLATWLPIYCEMGQP